MYLPFYSRFIAGTNLKSALKVSKYLKNKSVGSIIDYSVESSKYLTRNIDEIFKQIHNLDNSFIALKFSSLGIENDISSSKSLIDQFHYENSKKDNPNKFLIDAEYNEIQNKIYTLSNYAICNYNTKDFKHFYKTLQMYRNDIWDLYMRDIDIFMKDEKYAIKLVRGAYINTDKKYNIIHSNKSQTDDQYNNAITKFLFNQKLYPNNDIIIATHNKDSYDLAKKTSNSKNIYYATLLGMADNLCFDDVKVNKLKYVPYGPFFETTPYLGRRLIENIDMIKHI